MSFCRCVDSWIDSGVVGCIAFDRNRCGIENMVDDLKAVMTWIIYSHQTNEQWFYSTSHDGTPAFICGLMFCSKQTLTYLSRVHILPPRGSCRYVYALIQNVFKWMRWLACNISLNTSRGLQSKTVLLKLVIGDRLSLALSLSSILTFLENIWIKVAENIQ